LRPSAKTSLISVRAMKFNFDFTYDTFRSCASSNPSIGLPPAQISRGLPSRLTVSSIAYRNTAQWIEPDETEPVPALNELTGIRMIGVVEIALDGVHRQRLIQVMHICARSHLTGHNEKSQVQPILGMTVNTLTGDRDIGGADGAGINRRSTRSININSTL